MELFLGCIVLIFVLVLPIVPILLIAYWIEELCDLKCLIVTFIKDNCISLFMIKKNKRKYIKYDIKEGV